MAASRPGAVQRERTGWHALDPSSVERALDAGPHGLSSAEAAARLAHRGPNVLQEAPPPNPLLILLHQFQSPLIYLLLLATAVTLFLGEYIDAGVIAAVLVLNAVIGFTQEYRAESSVRALVQLSAPHARAVRDAREWDIPSRDLVPGDVVLLESGSRVPADLRLTATTALLVDESLLTGESVAVTKNADHVPAAAAPLADRVNMAFAGAIVASGRGRGYVVATGTITELGAIANELRLEKEPKTPLQHRLDQFARVIGLAVAASVALSFIVGLLAGQSPRQMFLVAVGLAVAAIPEGLPVVFTIALALGVRRMARRNAIVRSLPAVETLGSTTAIGSDKTGTLTENRMTVQELWAGGQSFRLTPGDHASAGLLLRDGDRGTSTDLPEHQPLYHTLLAGVLTNEAEVSLTADGDVAVHGDPTDAALLIAAGKLGMDPEDERAAWKVEAEVPFEPERQYSASVRTRGDRHQVFVKGAPERVLAMCGQQMGEDGPLPLDHDAVMEAVGAMAGRGLRVLAMAYRPLGRVPRVEQGDLEVDGLVFLGLQGMMDPPRQGVREAIAGCHEAGMRIVMITGDHAVTAEAIGRALGIARDGSVTLTGTDLEAMDDTALERRVREVAVYPRVTPEHKLRVVRALQHAGDVVAVTGDGVNDAPALKAADIGIAMGRGGTDVAREASDMVLADDNFVTIYAAVEEGRTTFENLRKATFFLISTGAGSIITILAALGLGWPVPLLPAQLLWLNLVTNGVQTMALAFEPGEPGVLQRPPRPRREQILTRLLWERVAIAGVVIAAGTLWLFRWELDQTGSLAQAQTVALTTMVLFQSFQVGNARSERLSVFRMHPLSNPFLFVSVLAALAVHAGALYWGPSQFILRVEPVEAEAWLRMVAVASTLLVAMELHKLVRRPGTDRTPSA